VIDQPGIVAPMTHSSRPPQGIVLCPLRYEVKQAARAGLGELSQLECCGPGRTGIERWFAHGEQHITNAPWVLLLGLAGALDPSISAGSNFVISSVVTGDGRCLAAPLPATSISHRAMTITSTDQIVTSRSAREALFRKTSAPLVDQESIHFAANAEQLGIRWGIVRGVSDDVSSQLPRGMRDWVDDDGRTRICRVALGLLASPRDFSRAIALGRASRRAMRSAAELAARVIESEAESHVNWRPGQS